VVTTSPSALHTSTPATPRSPASWRPLSLASIHTLPTRVRTCTAKPPRIRTQAEAVSVRSTPPSAMAMARFCSARASPGETTVATYDTVRVASAGISPIQKRTVFPSTRALSAPVRRPSTKRSPAGRMSTTSTLRSATLARFCTAML
jgi:hypothetical protein